MNFVLLALALCAFEVPSLATIRHESRCPPCPCAGESNPRTAGLQRIQIGGGNGAIDQGTDGGQGRTGQGYSGDIPNPPDAIAFTGTRSSSQYFFQAGPVIFDNVITNIGGGYDSRYGVFTAFESGIYFVKYHVASRGNSTKTTAVDLLRNTKVVNSVERLRKKEVVNSASGSGSSGQTSNTAVLFLNRHDMLSVQGRAETAIYCGDDNNTFCSFNVVLLKLGVFSDSGAPRPVPGW